MAARHLGLLAPILCYMTSFFFPAFHVKPGFYPGVEYRSSIDVLAAGWLGPISGNFGWYANVFFFWSLYYAARERYRAALAMSAGAAILSLFAFVVTRWNAPGIRGIWGVVSLGHGAYIWVASVWLLFLINGCLLIFGSSNSRFQGDASVRT